MGTVEPVLLDQAVNFLSRARIRSSMDRSVPAGIPRPEIRVVDPLVGDEHFSTNSILARFSCLTRMTVSLTATVVAVADSRESCHWWILHFPLNRLIHATHVLPSIQVVVKRRYC